MCIEKQKIENKLNLFLKNEIFLKNSNVRRGLAF